MLDMVENQAPCKAEVANSSVSLSLSLSLPLSLSLSLSFYSLYPSLSLSLHPLFFQHTSSSKRISLQRLK